MRLRETDIGWPVEELWVTGELLDYVDSLDSGTVVVVLDVPVAEAPWLALSFDGEWAGEQLRLEKRPLFWCYRPLEWPAWNHRHRKVARFWSVRDGLDVTLVEALQVRRLDDVDIVAPSAAELARQLRLELPVSREHLRSMLDTYWDRSWRQSVPRSQAPPEEHLWRAAKAVSEIQDALDELEG
jgi:hypothetical protein